MECTIRIWVGLIEVQFCSVLRLWPNINNGIASLSAINQMDVSSKTENQKNTTNVDFITNKQKTVRSYIWSTKQTTFSFFPVALQQLSDVSLCSTGGNCSELPAACITCNFNYSCIYGQMQSVTCDARPNVQCHVSNLAINARSRMTFSFCFAFIVSGRTWIQAKSALQILLANRIVGTQLRFKRQLQFHQFVLLVSVSITPG